MRYEKPRIMDLNGQAADGQAPQVCFAGAVANGSDPIRGDEACIAGGAAKGDPTGLCVPGGAPPWKNGGYTDCYSGGTPWFCSNGTAPQAQDFGCTNGPSNVAP